jgi:hypothetical protein
MNDITNLHKYFPRKSFEDSVWGYVSHHWDSLGKCAENELFESAFFHLHILYMSFLYIQAVRLYEYAPHNLTLAFILLDPEKETKIMKDLQDLKTPWVFSGKELTEKKIPKFFRIVGLSDDDIKIIEDPISFRNQRIHANGLRACENEEHFDNHCKAYIGAMELLLGKQKDRLVDKYKMAVAGFDEDESYEIGDNEVEEYLGTFSEREQEICSEQCTDRISEYLKEKFKDN